MVGFGQVSIQNLRRLRAPDAVAMRPLNVLIGPNGAGKTTFLDAWQILCASAQGRLSDIVLKFGGINSLIARGSSDGLLFTAYRSDPQQIYMLNLIRTGTTYRVRMESLIDEQRSDKELLIASNGSATYANLSKADRSFTQWKTTSEHETALSESPRQNIEVDTFRRILASIEYYPPIDASRASAVRHAQILNPSLVPSPDGADLASVLFNTRESEPEVYNSILDMLRAAFPNFDRLQFDTVGGGMILVGWREKGDSLPFYLSELSEGTIRFLYLVTLLSSRHLPNVTLIDEPEVSLHPVLVRLLVDLMREAAMKTQLIVATQSDRLVSFLQPEEVLVADVDEEGGAKFTWGDTFDLEKWLEDYSLGELWTMNVIGGRP